MTSQNQNKIALQKATEFLGMEFKNDTQKKAHLQCMFLELLEQKNIDSKTLIELANKKYKNVKEKEFDRRSYLNGFADGYASR